MPSDQPPDTPTQADNPSSSSPPLHQDALSDTPFLQAKLSGYVPDRQECDYAFFAHVFGAIASLIFLGFGVPIIAPLIILLVAKERKPFLMFHVNQAVVFQAGLFATYVGLLVVVTSITALTCGLGSFLYVLAVVPPVIGFVYPLIVGIAARNGEWKEYWLAGERVMKMKVPIIR